MKFFLDENFPKTAEKLLSSRDFEVLDIRGTKQIGLPDSEIFKMAQESEAIFLTTDMDFFHTIPFQFPHHHGVIIIALNQPNRIKILEKLDWCLTNIDLMEISDKVVLLRDNSYTIRK